MFENIENFKLISASTGISKTYVKIENRKTNSFILRTKGSAINKFQDKIIETKVNEMIFLPKGSCYEHINTAEEVHYTAISFHGDIENVSPALYQLEDFPEGIHIFNHLATNWKIGNASEKYKCLSLFYTLLSYVANTENINYSDKHRLSIIEPALLYLKEHIFDSSLTTDKLHKLCGISDTYFRKIFVTKFGVSPQKYITSKRIAQAKSIIESGDFYSIKEVSASVGFSDPLYFSRVFKNTYGISPSNMNKDI